MIEFFAVIGWIVGLVLAFYILRTGFALIVLSRGFTGKINYWGIAMMLVAMVMSYFLYAHAPFHVTIGA